MNQSQTLLLVGSRSWGRQIQHQVIELRVLSVQVGEGARAQEDGQSYPRSPPGARRDFLWELQLAVMPGGLGRAERRCWQEAERTFCADGTWPSGLRDSHMEL